jgi:hypothetical protein
MSEKTFKEMIDFQISVNPNEDIDSIVDRELF